MTHNEVTKDYLYKQLFMQNLVQAALAEWRLAHRDELYDISTVRERMSPALSRTRAYYLRIPDVSPESIKTTNSTQNVLICKDTQLLDLFPRMQELIRFIGEAFYGGWTVMGRIFITRLDGSADIGRHTDEGEYFKALHRHHIVLKSNGAEFWWDKKDQHRLQADSDHLVMQEGGVYVVNNSIPHWVKNGTADRTHLIFDAA